MKQRIYLDTSVIGGCFDEEFQKWSNNLISEIESGNFIAVISDITYREIELAPQKVYDVLVNLSDDYKENILSSREVEALADKYIDAGAVSEKYYEDALHIAIATIHKVDILVSWNFKHIVNIDRIRKYNAVNLMFGYSFFEIRTPREILKKYDHEE